MTNLGAGATSSHQMTGRLENCCDSESLSVGHKHQIGMKSRQDENGYAVARTEEPTE
jgi:hypothetical protein